MLLVHPIFILTAHVRDAGAASCARSQRIDVQPEINLSLAMSAGNSGVTQQQAAAAQQLTQFPIQRARPFLLNCQLTRSFNGDSLAHGGNRG